MAPSVMFFVAVLVPFLSQFLQKLKAIVLDNKMGFVFSILSSLVVFPFHKIYIGYSIYHLTEMYDDYKCKGEAEKDSSDDFTKLTFPNLSFRLFRNQVNSKNLSNFN
jgi:hypothetical protein